MVHLTINGLGVEMEPGATLLEAAKFLGYPVPTLCHMDGLEPYGACRLCVVEVGEGHRGKLVSSCTYPVQEGLVVRTASKRVLRARKMILTLMLASCPQSKQVQDLASQFAGITRQPFKQEHEDCLLCGLCVRMCQEQMMASAIGFRGRGQNRSIGTPFDMKSDICRLCGGCQYICPTCQLRCSYTEPERAICGGCENLSPPCVQKERFDDMLCYLDPCLACEIGKD